MCSRIKKTHTRAHSSSLSLSLAREVTMGQKCSALLKEEEDERKEARKEAEDNAKRERIKKQVEEEHLNMTAPRVILLLKLKILISRLGGNGGLNSQRNLEY